ncbi:MAG: LCP family protein [bacterium]
MQNQDKLLQDLEQRHGQKLSKIRRKKPSFFRKFFKILIYILIFFIIIFVFFYINRDSLKNNSESWIDKIPIISQIKRLAESSDIPLNGEDRGKINILFLGMGGENHEGAYLTDTIIVASFDIQTHKIAMLSIPRDMVVPMAGMGWPKINHVNSYAEMREPDSGGRVTAEVVSQILDAPIDYYFRLDFDGFKQVVDELGGIKVYIDTEFDDYHYPIQGEEKNPDWDDRFEHLHFDQGWQKMDGDLALKFARSRYAVGVEGTDFARAARQQKIIQAIKEKAMSKSVLFNPRLVSKIINDIRENILTNMKIWEMIRLWNMFKEVDENNIINKVLSNRPSGLLADSMSEDGAYTLIPMAGDFSEVKYLFKNMFYQIPENDKLKITEENARVEVLNGTFIPGLAGKNALDLEKYGFNIIYVANCSKQDFEKSVIYDLTYGEKKESLKLLIEKTDANISNNLPDWLEKDIKEAIENEEHIQPELIIILGEDANRMPLSTEDIDI